jgi:hypothetical protein
MRYVRLKCCPWGSLGTNRSDQNVRSSILDKVLTKHGVVCLKTTPCFKEEGEHVNGSHGKNMIEIRIRNKMKVAIKACNSELFFILYSWH